MNTPHEPEERWRIVLCNGMIRSASTWSYNVVMGLMRAAHGATVIGGYSEDIAQFLDISPQAKYRVLKCHTLDATGRDLVESGEAKVVFTCRNLADAAASFMNMFQYDFEHTLSALESSLEIYRFHQKTGQSLILSYQEVTREPTGAIAKIADYLSLRASPTMVEEVHRATSPEQAKARIQELKAGLDDNDLIRFDRFVYDRETLLNLDHIRDGRSGYGRASLSAQQSERIDALGRKYDFNLD